MLQSTAICNLYRRDTGISCTACSNFMYNDGSSSDIGFAVWTILDISLSGLMGTEEPQRLIRRWPMHESGEMYLETILILGKKNNTVRSIDIAEEMGFSKPSVSRAISKLKQDEYIIVDSDGHIALTEKGYQLANSIYERHVVLTNMLISLGVSKETAAQDACKMEHVVSDESFEAIKRHIESRKA